MPPSSALHGPGYYDQQAPAVTFDGTGQRAGQLPAFLSPATATGRQVADKPLLAQRLPELYPAR